MENLEAIAYTAVGLAVLAILIAALALRSAHKSRQQLVIFRGSASESDILEASAQVAHRMDELVARINRQNDAITEAQLDLSVALRHTGLVRYNAFAEAGGQFSFSVAMLDDTASGIVISGIQGQTAGRVYAKSILNGESDNPLTPEEREAILIASQRGEK